MNRTVSRMLASIASLALLANAGATGQSPDCGVMQGSTTKALPTFSGTLPATADMTTAGGSSHLYVLTQWGFARASLADPANPGAFQLLNVGNRLGNGGVIPITCDCFQGGATMDVAEAPNGLARMVSDWLSLGSEGVGGLPAQLATTGSSPPPTSPSFGQQINLSSKAGSGRSVSAIYIAATGKYFGYFSTIAGGIEGADLTSPTGQKFQSQAIQPFPAISWSGGAGGVTLKTAHVVVPGYEKSLLIGSTPDGILHVAEIHSTTGITTEVASAPLAGGNSNQLEVAVVNNTIFILSAEGSGGLRAYEFQPPGAIVNAGTIAGNFRRVAVRGPGPFPTLFLYRFVSGSESYIDLYDTEWLTEGGSPVQIESLRHTGAPEANYRGSGFEALVVQKGTAITAYLYRETTTSPEHSIHTDRIDISCSAAPPLLPARLGGSLPSPGPLFPATNWWSVDVSAAPLDSGSSAFISFINQGGVKHLHPDLGGTLPDGIHIYGMPYIVVDGYQPKKLVNFFYASQSDGVGEPFYPIPDQAITQSRWIEGGDPGNVDLRCCEDRHMLILDRDNRHLYELYNVYFDGTTWQAGSGAFFDMKTNGRRPETWTSADAAGLAILPGLIRYDEVYGPAEIEHAFRFTVRATNGYVWPASHVAGSDPQALPMGARMRLKASKDITGFDPAVQKIFRAMKKYGLIVADNGTDMYIGGTWDDRWDNDILNPAFDALTASDFEVVQLGFRPLLGAQLSVDTRPGGLSDRNGVFEPGERVVVEPSWSNGGTSAVGAIGTASGFTGPAGATYTIFDAGASYGSIPAEMTRGCYTTANCFQLTLSNPAPRPATHWDASFLETVTGQAAKTWKLHVGKSFVDTPPAHAFYRFVETLFHSGVTSGCGPDTFCPEDPVTRAEMAAFLLRGKLGYGFLPPAGSGTVFTDVPPGSFAFDWIEELWASGVTNGCGPGLYCPGSDVSREQMAVFLLRAKYGGAYMPPPAVGIFTDVPAGTLYAPWVERIYAEGITSGCGPGLFCPTDPVTRGQMAVFLARTFALSLYGP